MNWIDLVEERNRCQASCERGNKIPNSINCGEILDLIRTIFFSRIPLNLLLLLLLLLPHLLFCYPIYVITLRCNDLLLNRTESNSNISIITMLVAIVSIAVSYEMCI
jgi:hypothetical protein